MRQHITIKDIARIAGVSTSTVSRALSNSPELSEQTRQRILEICRREGYRVNALARSLICNKTNVIGLIVPEVTNPFYAELSLGIETHARSLGYNVILCNGQNDTKVTEGLFGFLISHQVDGIILASSQQDAGTMIQNFAPRLPTVLLGTPALVSGDEVNSVCIDNLAGGRLAAEHLLELGHRDIVYLGHRPNSLTNTASLSPKIFPCSALITSFIPHCQRSSFPPSISASSFLQKPPLICSRASLIRMSRTSSRTA